MSPKQRAVIIAAVALFSLSELFPPWKYEDQWDSSEKSAGHRFIFSPAPEVEPYSEMKHIFSIPDNEPQHGFTVRKDLARLYGQRFSLLFLMLGLLLLSEDRKAYAQVILGIISLVIGFSFVGLYIIYVSRYWS